jgi:3-oxoacyl-[acyl-carrier protein] reductase
MKGKTVLITGGSRGIGKAAADEFIKLGANVAVLHRNPAANVGAVVGGGLEIIADVSNEEQVKSAVGSVVAKFGKIDILINNAGIALDKSWDDRAAADWRKTLDVNLVGAWLVSKYVGEIMVKNKSGKIVNVASTSGLNDFSPYAVDYNASKAAMISLTKSLAIQFAPFVNVNAVAPGWVDTEMNSALSAEYLAAEAEKVCLKRIARPEEIAKIITFLAGDDAGYINGAVVVADGGRL